MLVCLPRSDGTSATAAVPSRTSWPGRSRC